MCTCAYMDIIVKYYWQNEEDYYNWSIDYCFRLLIDYIINSNCIYFRACRHLCGWIEKREVCSLIVARQLKRFV